MADVVKALATHLKTRTAVTSLVSTRIDHVRTRQSQTRPYVIITQVFEEPTSDLQGHINPKRAMVQVDCYSDTHTEADSVEAAISGEVEFFTGTMGAVTVDRVFLDSKQTGVVPPIDGSSVWLQVVSRQLIIWHED